MGEIFLSHLLQLSLLKYIPKAFLLHLASIYACSNGYPGCACVSRGYVIGICVHSYNILYTYRKKDTLIILTLTYNSNPYILCCSRVSIVKISSTVCRDWDYRLVSKYSGYPFFYTIVSKHSHNFLFPYILIFSFNKIVY